MSTQQGIPTGYPPPPNAAAAAANGYPVGTAAQHYGTPPPRTNYYYTNHNNTNPNPNMYYYQTPYYAAERATFFRRFVTGVISVLVILATILFIVWMIYRPRVPEFHINSLSVSQLNATSSQIFGNWTAQITVFNPNSKMHAYYEAIDGYVYYKSELLAQNRLAPFDQETKAERNVTATMVAAAAYVKDWVVTGVNADRSHGSVKFNVRFASFVHFKARGWRTRSRLLRVFCDDLTVAVSSNGGSGRLTGGNRNCFVSL